MPIDFELIREAQQKATGADIHAVAQQAQLYCFACEFHKRRLARQLETVLRLYVAGEAIRRAVEMARGEYGCQ